MSSWIEDSGVQGVVQARDPKLGVICIKMVLKAKTGGEINKGVTLDREEAQNLRPKAL